MSIRSNGFDKNGKAKEAGGKSKRKAYNVICQEFLESDAFKIFINSSKVKDLLEKLGLDPKASVDDAFRFSQFIQGLKGNQTAIKDIRDRAYGQATQHYKHSGEINSPPIVIKIDGKIIDK